MHRTTTLHRIKLLSPSYTTRRGNVLRDRQQPGQRHVKSSPRQAATVIVLAASRKDPYEVLGISRTSSLNDVKKAYRKKALKLHPDVNKAPDARERFMECKTAYQEILDRSNERNSRKSSSSNARSDYSQGKYYNTSNRTWEQRQPRQSSSESEKFYGLGDFFNDLEKEWEEYAGRKQKSSSSGQPKSLWEELADIGEEFVEFLEKGIGLDQQEKQPESGYNQAKDQYSGNADDGPPEGGKTPHGRSGGADFSNTAAASSFSSSYTDRQQKQQQSPQKSRKEVIDEELEALKRKMGLG